MMPQPQNVGRLNSMNNGVIANILTAPQSQDSAAVTTKEVAEAKTETGTAMEKMGNYPENAGRISLIDSNDEISLSSFIESIGRVLGTLVALSTGFLIVAAKYRAVAVGPGSMKLTNK